MKMHPVLRGQGPYAWEAADQLVDFAEENDMHVHGHALVWHQTTPAWLESFGDDDQAFEKAIRSYVTTVVEHYAGRVVSWEVLNEAFEDGSGEMRQSVFRRRMGPDYLARLFHYTRGANSDVLLFYNDYGLVWDAAKGGPSRTWWMLFRVAVCRSTALVCRRTLHSPSRLWRILPA